MNNIIWAASATGWNMSLFGSPKWTIQCGRCFGTFQQRIPLANYPIVRCPCGQANKLNVVVS